ncbi:MAG: hypothetical protein IIY70_05045, partial [Oscillospiraceae bacterium]|nr:hypothetical protein [Oscillospiraceae bacterium]
MKRNLRRLLALVLVLMLALPAFALSDESEAVVEPQAEPEIVLDEGILGGEDVEIDPEFEAEVTTYGGELVADGVQADAEPQNPEAPAENPENPGQNDDEEVAEDNAGEIAESNDDPEYIAKVSGVDYKDFGEAVAA